MDASKIESHSLKLNKEQFDLHKVISSVIKDLLDQIGKDNEKIKFLCELNVGNMKEKGEEIQGEEIILEADKNRITQVLSNLLCNAVKFTKEGNISVIIKKNNNEIIVGVKDEGQGISSEIMPKLFDKFITDSTSGTGLGLYICKNIIEVLMVAESGQKIIMVEKKEQHLLLVSLPSKVK